jgi:hypothetical protein
MAAVLKEQYQPGLLEGNCSGCDTGRNADHSFNESEYGMIWIKRDAM